MYLAMIANGTPILLLHFHQGNQGVVEDEMHFLFECPAYDHLRQQHAQNLFEDLGGIQATISAVVHDGQMWRFMEQNPKKMARFVFECSQFRRATLEGEHDLEMSMSDLVSTDDDVA